MTRTLDGELGESPAVVSNRSQGCDKAGTVAKGGLENGESSADYCIIMIY